MVENARAGELNKTGKTEFDEVMLAMDVVDTLRHRAIAGGEGTCLGRSGPGFN